VLGGAFGIQVLGLDETAAKIKDLPARLHAAEVRAVNLMVRRGESIFRRKVSGPVLKVDTGAYRDTISRQYASKTEAGAVEGKVGVAHGPASKYARIHETGGVIRAKNKPYLVFKTRDGAWHSVKSVTIPKRRPLGQTLDEVRPLMEQTFAAELKKAADA
jgi:hypothetical protein